MSSYLLVENRKLFYLNPNWGDFVQYSSSYRVYRLSLVIDDACSAAISIQYTGVWQTDGQTDTVYTAIAWRRLVKIITSPQGEMQLQSTANFVFVCLSQKPHVQTSRNDMLRVTVARCFSDGINAIRHVLPVLWMTSCHWRIIHRDSRDYTRGGGFLSRSLPCYNVQNSLLSFVGSTSLLLR